MTQETYKRCPNCDNFIPDLATVCQYCKTPVKGRRRPKRKSSILGRIATGAAVLFFGCIVLASVSAIFSDDTTPDMVATRVAEGALLRPTPTTRPEPTATKTNVEIQQSALELSYDELIRNTEHHVGKTVHYHGKVMQVIEGRNLNFQLRVNVTKDGSFWDNTVFVRYQGPRLLEDDIIEMWAKVEGRFTYETVLGDQVTIPELTALILQRR